MPQTAMHVPDFAEQPKMDGTTATRLLLQETPGVRVLILTSPTFQIIGKLEKFSDGNCGLSASFGNIAA
mgnify:CR=1 FL=1